MYYSVLTEFVKFLNSYIKRDSCDTADALTEVDRTSRDAVQALDQLENNDNCTSVVNPNDVSCWIV